MMEKMVIWTLEKGTKFSINRAGFIVLMLSAVIDITRYYIIRSFSDCNIYIRIGLFIYILSLKLIH